MSTAAFIPTLEVCCGCIPDLKTAAAVIVVLAIVTTPIISWTVVRHTYVIRIACVVTTDEKRSDVFDFALNNVFSFGLGSNAGLSPSCLIKELPKPETPTTTTTTTEATKFFAFEDPFSESSVVVGFILTYVVKYYGWVVLAVDILYVGCCINFLIRLFNGPDKLACKIFIIAGLITLVVSFIFGILYVITCTTLNEKFPIAEFIFTFVDIAIWGYFLVVVNSYWRRGAT